jgi:hypothetical protein
LNPWIRQVHSWIWSRSLQLIVLTRLATASFVVPIPRTCLIPQSYFLFFLFFFCFRKHRFTCRLNLASRKKSTSDMQFSSTDFDCDPVALPAGTWLSSSRLYNTWYIIPSLKLTTFLAFSLFSLLSMLHPSTNLSASACWSCPCTVAAVEEWHRWRRWR